MRLRLRSEVRQRRFGSIAVHADEFLSPNGHNFDRVALETLLNDGELKEWICQMTKLGLLTVKR